jgi:hypothetical protein
LRRYHLCKAIVRATKIIFDTCITAHLPSSTNEMQPTVNIKIVNNLYSWIRGRLQLKIGRFLRCLKKKIPQERFDLGWG